MVSENPFEYLRPLPPEAVPGREELVDGLVGAVRARELVAVLGPRRYGKTSILGKVAQIAVEVDVSAAVTVDCFGVASVGEFAVRFERAMGQLSGKVARTVRRLFGAGEVGVSLAPGVGFKATFGRRDAPDPRSALHELLGALVTAGETHGGVLLVLDEFQDVAPIEGLDAILRSHLQHARDVAVLFAGSRPSLLRALFEDRARPFYGQARLVEVGRLDPATAATIVTDAFDSTGKDAGDGGELLASFVDGHPQRLMLCAHVLWDLVDPGTVASTEVVGAAFDKVREMTVLEHRAALDSLDRTHRDALRAVAAFGTPYARVVERTLGLGQGSARSALRALLADGLVEELESGWRVVDPLLADWIRNELPPPG